MLPLASTRTRKKSCAIIAALGEICGLDPEDLSEQVIIAHEGAPMGDATVALQRDGVYYLGTFAGDRIGIVDLSP